MAWQVIFTRVRRAESYACKVFAARSRSAPLHSKMPMLENSRYALRHSRMAGILFDAGRRDRSSAKGTKCPLQPPLSRQRLTSIIAQTLYGFALFPPVTIWLTLAQCKTPVGYINRCANKQRIQRFRSCFCALNPLRHDGPSAPSTAK